MLISSDDRKQASTNKPLRIGLVGAGMVSRHHLIAWANIAIAHFVQSLRDNTPFETTPQDNLETLRLIKDCYRPSGWEALQ